jgi:uncharacterized membrane protein HdeD (DUF308 family)
MTSMSPNFTGTSSTMLDALRAHWKLFLFQGIVMIILGVVAVAAPAIATVAVDIFVGWLFLLSGTVGLIAMFSVGSASGFLWTLVTALLSLAVGALLIWQPVEGAVSLTLLLTAFFVAEGIFQIASSFTYRGALPGGWVWMLASGICDLLLAAVIIFAFPTSSLWALGLVVGVNLITSGAAVVTMAIAGRDGG